MKWFIIFITISMIIFLTELGGSLTETLSPDGAGTWAQWVGTTFSGMKDLNNNTAIWANTPPQKNQTYTVSNHTGASDDTINNVTIFSITKRISTSTAAHIIKGGDNAFYAAATFTPTTSFVLYQNTWATDPGGGNWNVNDINNLEIGMRLITSTQTSRYTNTSEIWAVVDYTPSTCTYSGSGNWNLNCADSCTFTTTQTIANGNNITITGTGTLTFNNGGLWTFSGEGQYIFINSGCTLNINTGGGWNN